MEWPEHPEWVAMLVDIMEGSQLGPTDGWFRKAVAQVRWNWDATRKAYDANDDGSLATSEISCSAEDFRRLDRDRDEKLTAADFDFTPHALAATPGLMVFMRADMDGSGKVTREEFERLFGMLDRDEAGFLALDDLQLGFAMPARGKGSSGGSQGPSVDTLVRGLFRQEIGSMQPGPRLNEKAPDFTLTTFDGKQTVNLSSLIGPKPIVLVFGSITCGPFRGQAGNVEKLFLRNKDRATFVMVYVREAHPLDGWHMESNDRVQIKLDQPESYEERAGVAKQCGELLDLSFPLLVDTIGDTVGAQYSGMPSRLYVIDKDGKVAYQSGRGPFGFKPAEMEQSLILTLAADSTNQNKKTAQGAGDR
jgi:peroxiredoxin